jgi:hypothetical protein
MHRMSLHPHARGAPEEFVNSAPLTDTDRAHVVSILGPEITRVFGFNLAVSLSLPALAPALAADLPGGSDFPARLWLPAL